jgi:hypothetical protein
MITKITDEFWIDFDKVYYINRVADCIYIFVTDMKTPIQLENAEILEPFYNALYDYLGYDIECCSLNFNKAKSDG